MLECVNDWSCSAGSAILGTMSRAPHRRFALPDNTPTLPHPRAWWTRIEDAFGDDGMLHVADHNNAAPGARWP